MWELDHEEGWVPKNWCFWIVVMEKTFESPSLGCKEIKPVNHKGNQPWIFTGWTDAEAPVFWSSDGNSWLIGNVSDAGKDWRQKEKRALGDEMAGRHHWCNKHELEQTPGDDEGQGGLACCSPWGCKMSDMTGQLNKNNMVVLFLVFLKNPIMFSILAVSIYIPTTNTRGFPFLHILSSIYCL